MPQIIVTAAGGAAFGDGAVTHRERVNVADFESQHFAAQLVERLGWAVEDAAQVELTATKPGQAESLARQRPAADNEHVERVHGEAVNAPSPG